MGAQEYIISACCCPVVLDDKVTADIGVVGVVAYKDTAATA